MGRVAKELTGPVAREERLIPRSIYTRIPPTTSLEFYKLLIRRQRWKRDERIGGKWRPIQQPTINLEADTITVTSIACANASLTGSGNSTAQGGNVLSGTGNGGAGGASTCFFGGLGIRECIIPGLCHGPGGWKRHAAARPAMAERVGMRRDLRRRRHSRTMGVRCPSA